MLDKKIVNIIRRRNMSDDRKLRSLKWRQAVASVDWLAAQLAETSKFQIYSFNTEAKPVLRGSDGVWLEVGDGNQLDEAVRILRRTVPEEGTNLKSAFAVIDELNPRPDNIILLIDSLPTMNAPIHRSRHGNRSGTFALLLRGSRYGAEWYPCQCTAVSNGRRLQRIHCVLAPCISDWWIFHEHQ